VAIDAATSLHVMYRQLSTPLCQCHPLVLRRWGAYELAAVLSSFYGADVTTRVRPWRGLVRQIERVTDAVAAAAAAERDSAAGSDSQPAGSGIARHQTTGSTANQIADMTSSRLPLYLQICLPPRPTRPRD